MGHVPSAAGSSYILHLLYIVPLNYYIPRMPKSMKMNSMNTTALNRELTEPTSELTS